MIVNDASGTAGLHFEEQGSGDVLVLLHGSGPGVSGASNFAANLPLFASHFRTIMLDLPGFGASPELEWTRPYPEHAAESVVKLLDSLGVEKAHVLGNSMGGWVGLEMAHSAPERVDRMVLMGPGGMFAEMFAPSRSEGARRLFEFVDSPSREGMRAWVDTMVSDPAMITDELIEKRYDAAMAPGAIDRMRRIFASLGIASTKPPLWSRTGEIPHKTLVTWGRDDRMLPLEGAFFATRRMPHADMHIFSDCGHWAQVERKSAFEKLTIEFLSDN